MNEKSPPAIEKQRIAILCVIAIVAILIGTLWPFNPWPQNQVTWLEGADGLRFERAGVVFSRTPLQPTQESPAAKSCTIELLLRPASIEVSDTILGFYTPGRSTHLLIRQWTDGLLVTHVAPDAGGPAGPTKFDVDHAFQPGKLLLVTITSGPNGTVVYRNAAHAQSFSRFTISRSELAGEIVLGTSPVDYRPWLGEIRGLALYAKELSPADVLRHYAGWTAARPFDPPDVDRAMARYAFGERSGREVHSDVASSPSLEIPASFDVPHKAMLTSAVKEFDLNGYYVEDVLLNIAGFLPLGAILCTYFSLTRPRFQAIRYTTLMGAVLSFTVEVLQTYIPRRVSGTTDIITNTLGALLGAAIVQPNWVRTLLQATKVLPKPKGSA